MIIERHTNKLDSNKKADPAADVLIKILFATFINEFTNLIITKSNEILNIDELNNFTANLNYTNKEEYLLTQSYINDIFKEKIYNNNVFLQKFVNYNKLFSTKEEKQLFYKWIIDSIKNTIRKDCFIEGDNLCSAIQKLAIDNKVKTYSQLKRCLENNSESLILNNASEFFNSESYEFFKQHKITLYLHTVQNIIKNLDFNLIINVIYKQLKTIPTNLLFTEFMDDPWNFINFKDNTSNKNIVYSIRTPYYFSVDRSGPLVIIGDEVLRGNNTNLKHHDDLLRQYKKKHGIIDNDDDEPAAYTEGYENYKNVGVGSYFNNVALLEYVAADNVDDINNIDEGNVINNSGNLDNVKSALIAEGFKKVYINNNAAWSSTQYRRIAKLFKK